MADKELKGQHRYAEFREEAIVERVKEMVRKRDNLPPDADLHIKLSYGNRKTGALVPSVSLIPVADCGNCKMCSRGCYDIRNVCYLKSVQVTRAINSALLQRDPVGYMLQIKNAVKFLRFFRWHVGGDIKDPAYLVWMVAIAEETPECQFLAFTKMYDIVNDYLDLHETFPSNLHIILSGWKGDTDVNPHNLPVSSPVWKDGSQSCMVTDDAIWCQGDCSACAESNGGCWAAKKGQTILFEAH